MGETHEAPQDHTLTGFRVYLGYTTERPTFSNVPMPNVAGAHQYRPPSQPLHFLMEKAPPTIVEKKKIDHIEERVRDIEGGGNYGFANMLELCLVPKLWFFLVGGLQKGRVRVQKNSR